MRSPALRSPHPSRPSVAAPAVPDALGVAAHPVDRGDRRRGLQLLLGILLFFAAQFVMVTVARVATEASGASFADGPTPGASLLAAGVGAALALGGFLLIVGRIGGRPGLALRGRGKLAELTQGLGIGIAMIVLSVGLIALLGGYRVTGISASPQLFVPLAIGLGAGVVEEVVFRGLLLGAAYLLTRRLWLVIGIHIAWNTVQAGVFSSAVSGTGRQSGLLLAEAQGPTLLNGGTMGIEGSLVSVLLGLAVGVAMLVLAARRGHLLPSVRAQRRKDAVPGLRGERVAD